MEEHDCWILLQTELAYLKNDKQYDFFRPLLDHLEPLVNQPKDENDRDFARSLLSIIKKLPAEWKQGIDIQTQVEKMSGGFIQRVVAEHVQQANRDFVINDIEKVILDFGSLLGDRRISPKSIDQKILISAEQRYRQRIKNHLPRETTYYVPLSGKTSELGVSPEAKRQSMRPEYQEWIQAGQEIKRVKLATLREAVDKYPCIILLGASGSGKTTALEHLARALADESAHIPLPLQLSEFGRGLSVEDFIVRGWEGSETSGHWAAPEMASHLKDFLEAGRLFCLFDALNECPREGYGERVLILRQFIDRWTTKGNRFMVTCRVLDYGEELSGLQRIEIVPLNDEQIRVFLERELPDVWEGLWQKLSEESTGQRRLLEMARNPYILTMMIDVFKKEGQLGRTRADLIHRSVNILIGWAERKCPSQEWLEAEVQKQSLSVLAFETQARIGSGTKIETELAREIMPHQVKAKPDGPLIPAPPEQVLHLAAGARIVEMPVDRSSVRFYHQLLQEYFAACEMLKRDPDGLDELWQWSWLETEMPPFKRPGESWEPLPPPPPTGWEETTILATGLMPENDDRLVLAMVGVNPVLAGRCLYEGQAEVVPEIRQAVVDRLLATIGDHEVSLRVRIAAGEVLGYLGDARIGVLVAIPAGAFLIGDDEDDFAKPQHEVVLSDYQIGKYPVTNAEFGEFIEAGGDQEKRWWTEAGWNAKISNNWIQPRWWDDALLNKPNQPVVGVSWYECLAYCHWRSAETREPYRMPSEAEWEKAARGTDGQQYPWGDEFEPKHLNSFEGDQRVMTTTPIGIYPTGKSPYDCLDMAGNVWEWTSSLQVRRSRSLWMRLTNSLRRRTDSSRILCVGDKIKKSFDYPYDSSDGREDLEFGDEFLRVLRGGSWYNLQGCACCTFRGGDYPRSRLRYTGFRVVVSPSLPSDTRHSGALDRTEK